jgi:hypothetical protein
MYTRTFKVRGRTKTSIAPTLVSPNKQDAAYLNKNKKWVTNKY